MTPRLHEQRMEALELDRAYGTIFVPSSSFLLVTAPIDAREAMRRFFEHLLPGGALVMPFMRLWPGRTPEHNRWSDWFSSGEAVRPEDGATVRRAECVRFDLEQQIEHSEDRYEVVVDGVVVQQELHVNSPAMRWYTQEQSLDLYREAGFDDLRAVSDFTDTPAAPDDRIWCVFGRRRG